MQEAKKVFGLQWLLMRHPPLAFHTSLSASFPKKSALKSFFAEWIPAPALNFAISKNQIIQSSGHVVRTGTIIAGRALFTAGRTPWSRNDSKPPVCPGE